MSTVRPFFFLIKNFFVCRLVWSLPQRRFRLFRLWSWLFKVINLIFQVFFTFRAHYTLINDFLAKLTGMSHLSQADSFKSSGVNECLYLLFTAPGMLGNLNDRCTGVGSKKVLNFLKQFLFLTKTLRADVSRKLNHDNAANPARNQFIINILIHFP